MERAYDVLGDAVPPPPRFQPAPTPTIPAAAPLPAPEAPVAPVAPPAPVPRYTLEQNADGSAVVRLRDPVRYRDQELTRLTIPVITGRHMRAASWQLFEKPTLGQVMAWSSGVVQPDGVLDEMEANLARDIATEVAVILIKKSLPTGAPPSPR